MKVGFLIMGSGSIGGAEKRYANLYKYMRTNSEVYLFTAPSTFYYLCKNNILEQNDPNITIVNSRLYPQLRQTYNQSKKKEDAKKRKPRLVKEFLSSIKFILYYIFVWKQVISWQRKNKIKIMHGVFHGVFAMAPFFYQKKIKTVISYNDSLFWMLHNPGIKWFATYRLGLKKASQIDILSDFVYNGLLERGITLNPEKVNISNVSFIDYSKCFVQPKELAVAFCGRFHFYKNPLLLVESIPIVLKHIPKAKFYFMGTGPLEEDIQHAVDFFKIRDNVDIRFVDHPEELLAKTMIFVSLQETNNYPSQSLMEAMACENAVIATDVGETRRLINNQNGILISKSAQELAEALISLLSMPEKCRQMGINAATTVKNNFAITIFENYIHNIYKKILL